MQKEKRHINRGIISDAPSRHRGQNDGRVPKYHRQDESDRDGVDGGIIGKGRRAGWDYEEQKTGHSEPKIPREQASGREARLRGKADRPQCDVMPDEPCGGCQQACAAERRRVAGKFSARGPGNDQRDRDGESQLARTRRRQHPAEFETFGGDGENEKCQPPTGNVGRFRTSEPRKRPADPARRRDCEDNREQRGLARDDGTRIDSKGDAGEEKRSARECWRAGNERHRADCGQGRRRVSPPPSDRYRAFETDQSPKKPADHEGAVELGQGRHAARQCQPETRKACP